MSKFVIFILALLVILAIAGSAMVGVRLDASQKSTEQLMTQLSKRADAAERQVVQLKQQIATLQAGSDHAEVVKQPVQVPATLLPDAIASLVERPKTPDGPILTNAMRDVVVTMNQCILATRTLRCSFTVTNQSPAEKKFILGVGGQYSVFEKDEGGTSVFDDVGNDFLSAGGGVANYAEPTCDSGSTCLVQKTLTPNVKTAGWLRFDNVDAKASAIKLLRLKWSDGEAWVPMDFRNMPIVRTPG